MMDIFLLKKLYQKSPFKQVKAIFPIRASALSEDSVSHFACSPASFQFTNSGFCYVILLR